MNSRFILKFLPVLIWIFTADLALGASSYQPQRIKVKSENPKKITVKIWQKKVFPELIGGVCESGGYFTECFKVQAEKCQAEAQVQLESCKSRVRMPQSFKSDIEAVDWSRKLGECLGSNLEKKWQSQQGNQAKCSSVEAWL